MQAVQFALDGKALQFFQGAMECTGRFLELVDPGNREFDQNYTDAVQEEILRAAFEIEDVSFLIGAEQSVPKDAPEMFRLAVHQSSQLWDAARRFLYNVGPLQARKGCNYIDDWLKAQRPLGFAATEQLISECQKFRTLASAWV